MTVTTLEWREYRYFPYERDFARREAESLFAAPALLDDEAGLRVPGASYDASRAERLTYFGRVVAPTGEAVIPRQAKLEASARANGSGSRQATRYSAHALHEYKGRFNPQVVRAIGNMLGLTDAAWVLDPFCGSGTTLLECAHVGWNAVGIDRNPLAIQIANAKLRALRNAVWLVDQSDALLDNLSDYRQLSSDDEVSPRVIRKLLGDDWQADLPAHSYLSEWFTAPVLAQVVGILRTLRTRIKRRADRAVFETILSDHIREASLQEPADLRIRRRKDAQPNYRILDWFAESLEDRLHRVLRAQAAVGEVVTQQEAVFGDNRGLQISPPPGGFDAVITSPPYETALPYIDTQRLSLVLFGHIKPTEIQRTEQELIGCREISVRERRDLESAIVRGDPALPSEVTELCRELLSAAAAKGNGFRRQNRPTLVFRYFRNMAAFFGNLRQFMRPGGNVALVVGPSRTTLGAREYVIDTPNLLCSVAAHHGYGVRMTVAMDTYQRYDMHQRNSIGSETLAVFQAPTSP